MFDLWESEHVGPVATDRRYRLFAAACCRRVWHLLADARARYAVEALERFADGLGTAADRKAALAALLRDGDLWTGEDDPHARATAAALLGAGANGCDSLRLAVEVSEECGGAAASASGTLDPAAFAAEQQVQCDLTRDLFGNPFRRVAFDPRWRSADAVALAQGIYEDRAFDRLPLLADALLDAGCESEDILSHCRGGGPHVRGCWMVDLVLGKE